MRIDRLVVQNFRCFERETFDFHARFNVVVGTNGAGKTALLDALAVAAGSWLLGIRGYGMRHIQAGDVRFVARQNGQLEFAPQYPVEIRAEGEALGCPVDWCRTLRRGGRTTSVQARTLQSLASDAAEAASRGESVVLPAIAYYGTGRLWKEPKDTKAKRGGLTKEERTRLEGYRDSIDPRSSPRTLTRWMHQQTQERFEEEREPALLSVVRRAMADVLDAETVDYRAKYGEIVAFFKDREPQVFSRLSDGHRNGVSLAGDLARRMAQLNPHLGDRALTETPGVVLIDELDLHLHPEWQRRIVHALKRVFPLVQFITTTHSPQIIGEVPPDELVILTRDGPRRTDRSLGLDSNAVLEIIQRTSKQNVRIEEALTEIFALVQRKDLDGAEIRIAALRAMMQDELGDVQAYDPPELKRAEAALSRVRIIGR